MTAPHRFFLFCKKKKRSFFRPYFYLLLVQTHSVELDENSKALGHKDTVTSVIKLNVVSGSHDEIH